MSSITTTLEAMGSSQAVDEETLTARGSWAAELSDLSLTPLTATAATEWTGTLTGMADDSTITATSDDDTELTVDGDTITGTFSDAGSPKITVTETLSGASNSPNTSVFTVVVAAA